MKRFFYADFVGIVQSAIDNTEQQVGVHADAAFKEFLVHFYTEAIAGLLISEFTEKDGHDPEQAVEYLASILKSSLPEVLKSAEKKDEI